MGPKEPLAKNIVNDAILKDIREAVESIDYGSVEIKIHNSKIIQIDVVERKRFDDVWRLEGGGGI
ncbi:MAG: YezD family protein [Candidatus Omnitrophica bacterium]|nr:YezD family protein [Candidatus Omnitrophota bacterium]